MRWSADFRGKHEHALLDCERWLLSALSLPPRPRSAQAGNEWPVYGGDLAATKFSTLTDINRGNVAKLAPAWEWATGETREDATARAPRKFPGDAADDWRHAVSQHVVQSRRRARREHRQTSSGRTIRKAYRRGTAAEWHRIRSSRRRDVDRRQAAANLHQQPLESHRARRVDRKTDSRVRRHRRRRSHARARIETAKRSTSFTTRRRRRRSCGAISSSSATASPTSSSTRTIRRATCRRSTSKPASASGGSVPTPQRQARRRRRDVAGRSRGRPSATRTSGRRSASTIAADLIYLPVSTPSNDWYGGARKGNNLFAESIVCLEAKNGQRSGISRRCITVSGTTTSQPRPVLATVQSRRATARHRRCPDEDGLSLRLRSREWQTDLADRRTRGTGERRARRASRAVAAVSDQAAGRSRSKDSASTISSTSRRELKALALDAIKAYRVGSAVHAAVARAARS